MILMDEDNFEDSFSHEGGEMSTSSKKKILLEDDSLARGNEYSRVFKDRENSPPPTEIVKVKSNLSRQFDNEMTVPSL
jgi:hypothetical protein